MALRLRWPRSVGALCILALAAPAAQAQTVRLSTPAEPTPGVKEKGDVDRFGLTCDGLHVVYTADQRVLGRKELFSRPFSGGGVTVLNAALKAGTQVEDFALSPDGTRVAFVAELSDGTGLQVYVVPVAGGPNVRVSSGLSATVVGKIAFTPDGSKIVFQAGSSHSTYDLYRAETAAVGTLERITGVPQAVLEFEVDPTSSWVAIFTEEAPSAFELFSAPLSGSSAAVKLSPTTTSPYSGFVVSPFEFTPDGTRVLFLGRSASQSVNQLYVAPSDGSLPALQVHPELDSGGVVGFALDPAGSDVFFRFPGAIQRAPLDGRAPPITIAQPNEAIAGLLPTVEGAGLVFRDIAPNSKTGLYSVRTDGSQEIRALFEPASYQTSVIEPRLTPDRRTVVFDTVNSGLFGAPANGSTLAHQLVSYTNLGPEWVLSPDGLFVAWTDFLRRVWVTSTDGAQLETLVLPPLPSGATGASSLTFTPDHGRVLFQGDLLAADDFDVLSVSITGAPDVVKHNGKLAPEVSRFLLSPDGSRAVYVQHDDFLEPPTVPETGKLSLYSVPTDGSAPAVQLAGPFPAANYGLPSGLGTADGFSPDGGWFLFVVRQPPIQTALYAVRTDGSGPPVELPSVGAFVGFPWRITPDSSRVVVPAVLTPPFGGSRLYSVPVDGSGPPIDLGPGKLQTLVPDGSSVLYVAAGAAPQILVRAVDGSGSALPVTPVLPSHTSIVFDSTTTVDFPPGAFSPDGTRVLYMADVDVDDVFDLYVVPLDGGTAPAKLSGSLPATHDVIWAEFTADGNRVVYIVKTTGSTAIDAPADILSVQSDGSAAPILLATGASSTLTAFGAREALELAPDGSRAAYSTAYLFDDSFGQSFVPGQWFLDAPDGSSSFAIPGALGEFGARFTPDSLRFVYSDAGRVLSYRVDGTEAPIELSQTSDPSEQVGAWALSPDGRRVVYSEGPGADGDVRLFATPVELQNAGPRLTEPAVGVRPDFAFSADNRVVFIADLTTHGRLELYSTEIRPGIRDHAPRALPVGSSQRVTIRGRNFLPDAVVLFGGVPSPEVEFVDATELRALPPLPRITRGAMPTQFTVSLVVSDSVSTSTSPASFTYFFPGDQPTGLSR